MNLSNAGYSLIVKHETGNNIKKYLTAYKDPVGKWTIGIGSTYYEDKKPVRQGDVITEDRAKQLFYNNIREFENAVSQYVKVPLSQNQFDSLVSFAYNVGIGAFSSSTLLKRINAKASMDDIYNEFIRWKYGTVNGKKVVLNGLLNRRIDEAKMFLGSYTTSQKISIFAVALAVVLAYFFLSR